MWPHFYEWIALFIKWFHVICGIAWIGASFYFTWLDNSLETPPDWKKKKGIKGDLWAVHGGGFYEVAKYQAGPEKMPEHLHWFKWEAYTTWITGSVLMVWMYYFNAQAYLIDPRVMELSSPAAISLGIGGIMLGVLIYELIMRSPLANNSQVFVTSIIVLGTLFFYGFTELFSGRGAFIHMGALIGSIMVNNVFHKIIPGQRKMVAQVEAGEAIDPKPGLEGKQRSIHNNYFTLPVIFLMISNHYPMIYQHAQSWLVGSVVMLLSAYIRHYFNLKHSGKNKPAVLVSGITAMFVLAIALSIPKQTTRISVHDTTAIEATNDKRSVDTPSNITAKQSAIDIIGARCTQCHSSTPNDDVFTIAPSGAIFDNWEDIQRWKARIIARTVETRDMPFLNKTDMTDEERALLLKAFNQIQPN
ncbi:urate hydroxylase PuuD [Vibrio sp. RC27]